MAKATRNTITANDILASLGNRNDASQPITARTVNFLSIKTAKIGAAFTAAGDNFGAHFDMERNTLRELNNLELRKEAERCAARLNAALS